uniref:ORF44c n=1 Tax=Pinus koraiensis TaxID=88728 RepID=A4QMJ3_PINKO|nr:ORF44c [Pinus koraiensis]
MILLLFEALIYLPKHHLFLSKILALQDHFRPNDEVNEHLNEVFL